MKKKLLELFTLGYSELPEGREQVWFVMGFSAIAAAVLFFASR